MNDPGATLLDDRVLEELLDSVGGDRSFVVELVEAFLADGTTHVEAIEAALAADDDEALVRPAHTLKSSSATIGAAQLASTARRLEMAARSGALTDAGPDAAGRVRAEWDATNAALRSWLQAGDHG